LSCALGAKSTLTVWIAPDREVVGHDAIARDETIGADLADAVGGPADRSWQCRDSPRGKFVIRGDTSLAEQLILVVACAVLLGGWFGVAFLRSHLADPESSNITDLEYDRNDKPLPEFYASDPGLTQKQPHRVQERFVDPRTKQPVNRMPYFIAFADGRYVFGFTNAEGTTKPVFTSQPPQCKVSWYEEAWANWHRMNPK
jgi:hypothetical protein